MRSSFLVLLVALGVVGLPAHGATTLYSQNFEAPVGFVNDGGDINIFRTVNQLYGNQPPGFAFAQQFTVETLLVGGTQAFGTGFQDPAGTAGSYVVSMLSNVENDLLSLSFNVGAFQFLNFGLDISSIDLDRFGGPFVPTAGAAPVFQFSLFDNPAGTNGLAGNSVLLDSAMATGTVAPNKFTFDWSNVVLGLDAQNSTNGNVTLQIDLLSGGYAAMDNFVVVASDVKGVIPEPSTYALMLAGIGFVGFAIRRRRRVA
jgi:PEP-CTERM motif